MKILVTGANGFLGRHVVRALCRAGHSVRGLVRPASVHAAVAIDRSVEIFPADLRSHPDLTLALEGIEVVIHLAAAMGGSDQSCFADTVIGTERLFEAMTRTPVKRLVLCSSFSVYEWLAARGTVDEELPLLRDAYGSGSYAAAKLWQERMAWRMADTRGWELSVMRPGFIWGRGNENPSGSCGRSLGPLHLVFGPARRPAFTHVLNCADAFRATIENPQSVGQTFNIVDNQAVTAWRFLGEYLKRSGSRGLRVPLPYWILKPLAVAAYKGARIVFGERAQVPSLLVPNRFALACKPLRYSTDRLESVLSWRPPHDFASCLGETYAPPAEPGAAARSA